MTDLNMFGLEKGSKNFEDFKRENGDVYWLATDFMKMLGYEKFSSFKRVINKAISATSTLNIPVLDNFQEIREVGKVSVTDYRLSRFACYLTAMNANVKKKEVAAAQAWFITLAESMRQLIQDSDSIVRVRVRGDLSEGEKSLSSVAHSAGVDQYAYFQNAGYRGMYNMNISKLKEYKGMKKQPGSSESLLDYMGKEELAANLFRITQTERKIRTDDIRGQKKLEIAAEETGKIVRKTMAEISGQKPEDIPLSEDIRIVKGSIKKTEKGMKKLDKPEKRKKGEKSK